MIRFFEIRKTINFNDSFDDILFFRDFKIRHDPLYSRYFFGEYGWHLSDLSLSPEDEYSETYWYNLERRGFKYWEGSGMADILEKKEDNLDELKNEVKNKINTNTNTQKNK